MIKNKRSYFFILIIGFLLLIIFLCFNLVSYWNNWSIKYSQKKGNEIIEIIENYKKTFGRLPDSFCEIGLKPDEYWAGQATDFYGTKYFYEKLSDTEYEIYFSLSVGEALYFNSNKAEWNINP